MLLKSCTTKVMCIFWVAHLSLRATGQLQRHVTDVRTRGFDLNVMITHWKSGASTNVPWNFVENPQLKLGSLCEVRSRMYKDQKTVTLRRTHTRARVLSGVHSNIYWWNSSKWDLVFSIIENGTLSINRGSRLSFLFFSSVVAPVISPEGGKDAETKNDVTGAMRIHPYLWILEISCALSSNWLLIFCIPSYYTLVLKRYAGKKPDHYHESGIPSTRF